VAMFSNIISKLLVFKKFVSENEYLRVCVYRVLLWYTEFKLESVRHPCNTSLFVGILISGTKRTELPSLKKNHET
jgi:hypothetical protein